MGAVWPKRPIAAATRLPLLSSSEVLTPPECSKRSSYAHLFNYDGSPLTDQSQKVAMDLDRTAPEPTILPRSERISTQAPSLSSGPNCTPPSASFPRHRRCILADTSAMFAGTGNVRPMHATSFQARIHAVNLAND